MPFSRNMFKRRPIQEETPWEFEFGHIPSTKSKTVARKAVPALTKEDLDQIAGLQALGACRPISPMASSLMICFRAFPSSH
jgi:hypothetical protein